MGGNPTIRAIFHMSIHDGHNPVIALAHRQLLHQITIPEESVIGPLPQGFGFILGSKSGEALKGVGDIVGVREVEVMGGEGTMQEVQVRVFILLSLFGQGQTRLDQWDYRHLGHLGHPFMHVNNNKRSFQYHPSSALISHRWI